MTTPRFANIDTRRADGFYVQFERVIISDDTQERPDENDEGFWPSRDHDAPGYVGESDFDAQMTIATERMEAWERGDWEFVGVRARAHCMTVRNGVGTMFTLESPGLWGIESDVGDYLNDVFEDEKAELLGMIEAMRNPVIEQAA